MLLFDKTSVVSVPRCLQLADVPFANRQGDLDFERADPCIIAARVRLLWEDPLGAAQALLAGSREYADETYRFAYFQLAVLTILAAAENPSITGLVDGKDIFRSLATRMHTAFLRHQGEFAEDALSVPQGQFGISDSVRIGTHSVFNCVSIAMRTADSPLTMVAHLEEGSDLTQLVSAGRQTFGATALVQARLLGMKTLTLSSGLFAFMLETFLRATSAQVISADLHEPSQPSAWIISPQDFSVTQGVPMAGPDPLLRVGWIRCTEAQRTISEAFDTRTVGTQYNPGFGSAQSEFLRKHYPAETFLDLVRDQLAKKDAAWALNGDSFWLEAILRAKDFLEQNLP